MSARAILLAAAGALLAAGTWLLFHHPKPSLRRVEVEAGQDWAGFTSSERDGLVLLVRDLAELSGATVVDPPPGGAAPDLAVTIQVQARREGLAFHLRARRIGPSGAVKEVDLPPDTLPRSLLRLVAELGLQSREAGRLLASAPDDLLPLAESMAIVYNGGEGDLNALSSRLDLVVGREPDNAFASLLEGMALYRMMVSRAAADLERQGRARQAFQRSLAQVPHYPRAAVQYAFFLTDTGGQRDALDLLFEAAAAHPNSAGLQGAIAYAARTAGLLEGARAALLRQERLQGAAPAVENTWLYLGDRARFGETLGVGSDELPDPTGDFYRGYLKLIDGAPADQTLPYFRRAEAATGRVPHFSTLASVFRLALDGRKEEARLALRDLEATRTALQVPDGEFTFKLAEAHAFLGDLPQAMDAAIRASNQGFGCTAWYERAPLLRPLQGLPRWQALIQHLRERQQMMEARFPLRRFES